MNNLDTIFINNLTTATIIGMQEWETAIKQKVIFDIELFVDINKVYSSEDAKDTVDYKNLIDKIVNYLSNKKFKLLETLADKVASLILKEEKIKKLKLKVTKPGAVPFAKVVGVNIERSKI